MAMATRPRPLPTQRRDRPPHASLAPASDPPSAPGTGSGRPEPAISVELIACGQGAPGDAGAPSGAVAGLDDDRWADVEVRLVDRLTVDDLLAVPPEAGVVIVDSAAGLEPGWVVELPLRALADAPTGVRTRSCAALQEPVTVGVASMIRGRPLVGTIVLIGRPSDDGSEVVSWPVAAGVGTLRVAISHAIERTRRRARGAAGG